MNPFTQLIGPLLLVHLVVLLKGKGKKGSSPKARFRNKAAQWLSLIIVTVVAWIFTVIAVLIIAASLVDSHANFRIVIHVIQTIRDWSGSGGLMTNTFNTMLLAFLPIPIAILLTMVQQVRRRWLKIKN
jgi:ABC-type Fe3+ transport system permease subunit